MTSKSVKWIWVLTLSVAPLLAQDLKRVSTAEAMAAVTSKVQPEFPQVAKQLKLAGTVELEATVAEDGTVQNVRIVSGNPVFTKVSSEVLKKWKFKPFTADGKPVKVVAPFSFTFRQ